MLAYIDPGSGALAWQLAVAAAMGFLFYLSKIRSAIWRRISSVLKVGAKKTDGAVPKDVEKD
jgi:hypothetical protein